MGACQSCIRPSKNGDPSSAAKGSVLGKSAEPIPPSDLDKGKGSTANLKSQVSPTGLQPAPYEVCIEGKATKGVSQQLETGKDATATGGAFATSLLVKEPGSGLLRAPGGAFAGTCLEDIAPEIAPALGLPYQVHACGPPVPPCDHERLQTMHALNAVTPMLDPSLLEAPPDPELNTILKLVAAIFQAPATLVALFDDKRIFIRDSEGAFQRGDFPWRWSFCGWTMASKNDQIMVIPDASKDARFCQNYAVKELGVQFYCGTPLIASNGHRLGTLCFADFKPRPFDATSAHILNNLSELVVRHLEKDIALQMRTHSNSALTEAYHNLQRTVDCFDHCVALVDTAVTGWRLIYTNLAWNKAADVERERMQNQLISDVFCTIGGGMVPNPLQAQQAAALEEFSIHGVRMKLLLSASGDSKLDSGGQSRKIGSSSSSSSGQPSFPSGAVLYNLKFRAACKADMDDSVLPIGIPSFIPTDSCASMAGQSRAAVGADRLYFVTMEDVTKALASARNSSSNSSWANLDTPDTIAGLKMGLLLGKGGYGSVYHATLFGTPVAVKLLEQDVALPCDGSLPALPTEVLLSQELRHPHIVATLKCASRRMALHYHQSSSPCVSRDDPRWARSSDATGDSSRTSNNHESHGNFARRSSDSSPPASPSRGQSKRAGTQASPVSSSRGRRRVYGERGSAPGWAIFDMQDVQEGDVEGEDEASMEDLYLGGNGLVGNGSGSGEQGQVSMDVQAAHGAMSSVVSDMGWPGADSACMLNPALGGPASAAAPTPRPGLGMASDRTAVVPARPSLARSSAGYTSSSQPEVVPMVPIQTWIVMEFCDKGCLQDAVDRGWLRVNRTTGASVAVGPGSEANMRAVLSTAREMASALSFLHARGIVHGDLSAWNVMLCTTGVGANDGGRGFIAKVADFGLSKQMDVRTKIKTQTYGTLTHMPPEALRDGIVSRAVDVYSFGVLLWQMYTGSRPWAGLSHGQIIYMVAAQNAKLQLPPGTPDAYAELCLACLAGDPAQRPTFDAIVDAVETMMDLL